MSKQLLFYENAVPVSFQRHTGWSVKSGANYIFAKNTNSVPLTALEFSSAAQEYAVVFAGAGDAIVPVVILGVLDSQNLYVDETGKWNAKYIPAFVRRYPFVFSTSNDGANFTLCMDEDFPGCNKEGVGERLFDSEGERTQYLRTVLNFLSEYQAHFRRTQLFCNKLRDLNLLEPMQAQFTLPSGKKTSLTGFMAINREKLRNLPGDTLAELSKTGELELMYTHLQSMRNFSEMLNLVTASSTTPGSEETKASTDQDEPRSDSASEDSEWEGARSEEESGAELLN